ncbi:MAG: hypothetical protein H0X04_08130 [Chthoniobacterales bacterium]|nr:hypothetical protein [Chthoniobacterales bacterium]
MPKPESRLRARKTYKLHSGAGDGGGVRNSAETMGAGEPLMIVHARDESSLASVLPLLERAIEIG